MGIMGITLGRQRQHCAGSRVAAARQTPGHSPPCNSAELCQKARQKSRQAGLVQVGPQLHPSISSSYGAHTECCPASWSDSGIQYSGGTLPSQSCSHAHTPCNPTAARCAIGQCRKTCDVTPAQRPHSNAPPQASAEPSSTPRPAAHLVLQHTSVVLQRLHIANPATSHSRRTMQPHHAAAAK